MSYATIPDFSAGALTSAELNIVVDAINALFPVGFYGYLCRAATTAETLVNNSTSVLRATYPDLNTLFSGLGYPFGTVDGTHMTLPDAQGRSLVSMSSGGNANVDALGDSDAVAKASRTPKGSVTVSGTTGAHTHGAGSYAVTLSSTYNATTPGTTSPPPGSAAVTGTSGSSTASFSGSGTVPGNYLVGGTLFIKAKA